MGYSSWDRERSMDFNYTTTGIKDVIDLRLTGKLMDEFAVEFDGVGGAPTTLTAALEGSLDGTDWTSLIAVTQANNAQIQFAVGKLVRMIRINISALTLGPASSVHCNVVAA